MTGHRNAGSSWTPARQRGGVLWGLAALAALAIDGRPAAAAGRLFIRGDANGDRAVDISDPQRTLTFLFLGGAALPCRAAADSNADGALDIADPVHTLGFLFLDGDPPPAPGPFAPGPDPGSGLDCLASPFPDNQPPSIRFTAPAAGAILSSGQVTIRGNASDDHGIDRVLLGGRDIRDLGQLQTVTPGSGGPRAASFSAALDLAPGPHLLRLEVVDRFGAVSFAALPVGVRPIIEKGERSEGLAIDVSGSSGFREIETIAQPFLGDIQNLVNAAIAGRVLFDGPIAGFQSRVTGDRAEVVQPISFRLDPAAGQVRIRAEIPRLRVFANGRTDFGFLGTDNWRAEWTGNLAVADGGFTLAVAAGGARLQAASTGFAVTFQSSDLVVRDFGDPFGILNALVNLLVGLFNQDIENQVRRAFEDAIGGELVPVIGDALSALQFNFDLGEFRTATSFAAAASQPAGLSIGYRASVAAARPLPEFDWIPGSTGTPAPLPAFPVAASASHPVDLTLSLADDFIGQLLLELVRTGALEGEFELPDQGQLPFDVGLLAQVLGPRLLQIPGVDPRDAVSIRVGADLPPSARFAPGPLGARWVGEREEWRYLRGAAEPPAAWRSIGFDDSRWTPGAAGFGYSSNPAELSGVGTILADMPNGYPSVFLRRRFTLPGRSGIDAALAGRSLLLRVVHDDGFVAYLNGQEVARVNMAGAPGSAVPASALALAAIEPAAAEIDLGARRDLLREGENVLAIQAHNAALDSSDLVLIPALTASRHAAGTARRAVIEIPELLLEVSTRPPPGSGRQPAGLFTLGLRLDVEAGVGIGPDPAQSPGGAALSFAVDPADGLDADALPDAVPGGPGSLAVSVVWEAIDLDDGTVSGFFSGILNLFAPLIGELLGEFDLPEIPIPELAFDLDQDGTEDVAYRFGAATLVSVDTDADGRDDWLCILIDLIR